MSTRTILQLPVAIALLGTEYVEGAQPATLANGQKGYDSVRFTTAQIAALASALVVAGNNGVITDAPSGTINNYTVGGHMGAGVGFIDITPTGAWNITGLQAGFDGQIVVITNLSAITGQLNARNIGSLAANQFRMAQDADLTQYNGRSFKYSASIGMWVAL